MWVRHIDCNLQVENLVKEVHNINKLVLYNTRLVYAQYSARGIGKQSETIANVWHTVYKGSGKLRGKMSMLNKKDSPSRYFTLCMFDKQHHFAGILSYL